MSPPAIRVSGLSKSYRVSHASHRHDTFTDLFTDFIRRPFRPRKAAPPDETFWALRDVDFEVKPGEVVGIIGRNGAGKSTLLKILSRITAPTDGRVEISGRVASLLEVGTGFHPELTGRENIYLNGSILGMRRTELARKFDAIVDFAGVERFLDTPLKRYSSGMYVRLAFAVAAHLDPEILIVDEVLAVGDAEFQRKCLGTMKDAATQGRTVILVSHNMSAIHQLCGAGLLLEAGRIADRGPVEHVLATYSRSAHGGAFVDLNVKTHSGAGALARLHGLWIQDESGAASTSFAMGSTVRFRLQVSCHTRVPDFEAGIKVSSRAGIPLHYFVSTWEGLRGTLEAGEHVFDVTVPALNLLPGQYLVSAWTLQEGRPADDAVEGAAAIEIFGADINGQKAGFDRYALSGCEVYAPSVWTRTTLTSASQQTDP